MKIFFVAVCFVFSICAMAQQNIGIGTNTPAASAMLHINSTTKGLLIPRLTTVQRTAIASPANGLQVYDTNTNSFWYYKSTAWVEMGSGGGGANYWGTNGFGSIYNNNTGNVGIGTQFPGSKFSVNGDGSFTGTNIILSFSEQGGYAYEGGALLLSTPVSGIESKALRFDGSKLQAYTIDTGDPSSDDYASSFSINPLGGNVGIGTGNPLENSKLTLQTNADYNTAMTIRNPTGSASFQVYVGGPNNNNAISLGTQGAMPLAFYTNGVNRVSIGDNGAVGLLGSAATSFFNYGLNEATYIRAGKTGSTVFLNDTHNGNVDIAAGGGRVNVQGSGLYAPSSGGLNIVPLGVISVSFEFVNPDFTNVIIENTAGTLAAGTYASSYSIGVDDFLYFTVDLNFTQLSGYSKVFAVGYPNFDSGAGIFTIKQTISKDATSAKLNLFFVGDSFTKSFYYFNTSGTYIIYGVR